MHGLFLKDLNNKIWCLYNHCTFQNMTTDERTLADLTAEVANAHRALQGLPPGVAGYHYIITVQQMEGYGLEHYPAKV